MKRRSFLKRGATGALFVSFPGMLMQSCTRNMRTEIMEPEAVFKNRGATQLDSDGYKILYYASLAPSGHNSQPWFVKIVKPYEWIIGSDKDRWLPAVDGNNREVMLSIGCFLENLVQAAGTLGYEVEPTVITADRYASDVVRVRLVKSNLSHDSLATIISRRTVKSHFLNKELRSKDVKELSQVTSGHLYYFPKGSQHADLMAKEAVDNFIIQFNNNAAMQEAADWTRLRDAEAKKYRDGLTPDGMEISGMAGFYVRHFMDKQDVTDAMWTEKAIEKVRQQADQGAGWLVITSDGNAVADLIESGRRFQRMALMSRQKNIAIHPMTQALEEKHGRKNIRENHSPEIIPQFMLRVGYLDDYPDPVSLRRPVEWFIKNG